jgi:hypothetical protein
VLWPKFFLLNLPVQPLENGMKVGGLMRLKVGDRGVLVGFSSKSLGEEFIAKRQFLLPASLISWSEAVLTKLSGFVANEEILVFASQPLLHDFLANADTFEYEKNIVSAERVARV